MEVNTIRLALYSDKGAGFSKSLYKKVDEGIQYATELGMYVVIDWHILSDGNPKTNQKKALSFFARYAKKYGKQNNILYEICNEPNVGTPTWSQDVDVVAKSPLKEKNIVYSLHFYAATHTDFLRNKCKSAYQSGLPMLVSEFSICDASGNGGIDKKSASKWMKLLKKYKIGHIAWNISNKNETSALIQSKCGKTDKISYKNLSKSGKWIAKWWKK